ncbi:MAG: hypothetical protein ACPGR2_06300 [Psychrobium sp.]
MTEVRNSIDTSIETIEAYVTKNQEEGHKVFSYLWKFSSVVLTIILTLYIFPLYFSSISPDSAIVNAKIPDTVLYGLFAIFVIVFGVMMAVYRFHLNEIARAEHYKMGFMRIRVAANNHEKDGFKTEVRESLTVGAFAYQPPSVLSSNKEKKVESPLPGHPTSDLSAIVLNKFLEGMEIKKK